MTAGFSEDELFFEAEERYRAACERREAILATWEELERPLLTAGSTGQLVEHPLVRMIRDCDVLCCKLGAELRRRARPGRDPVAVVTSSVGPSPAVRKRAKRGALRAV